MPSVLGVLERRERVALARAEELRAELERLQAAVAEADEAARRAVIAREETVEALAEAAEEAVVVGASMDLPAADAAGPRVEVPLWREGVGIEVLPPECARIVALVHEDAAGGGDGVRARAMREHLGWSASDAREQAARFRAKRLVERGWLTEGRPGLFRPRTA
ncbi:hypothetical protein OG689_40175 [Kitasatospora sp. NBC_00240]|uniref:hypothetical protein n=1 Tax=Kitasatospora sp. NBC_00240 TaxID=2903567 RepID=UPI0022544DD8|nr:hypothetical protein [Kitasatospora sp. NBC_00240]MCX5215397.1 hypothetical protein [Kitasatospora sp. NBC_00240]